MHKILILLIFSFNLLAHESTPCDSKTGMADIYPCKNIDLLSRLHIEHLGGNSSDSGSDIWGWTDSETGKEYALMTLSYGTAFVDITDPSQPIYLGKLATATVNSTWRDIKTYMNHAYIVSEASGHGVQVFDLTQLRDIAAPPIEFSATNRYTGVGSIHNIIINEASGFAYVVGGNEGNEECNSGLHMLNLENPSSPTFAGCFANDGYTHDAQCVNYIGPDTAYSGKEICFNSNEDTITIVDVSNKSNPVQISRTGYDNSQYTHQGWLTEDHRYFLMNDEVDERNLGHNTKTYIWDMLNLGAPQLIGFYNGDKESIDHNLYIKGNYAFLTNYTSGLSVVDITNIGSGVLKETANFDGFPSHDAATFDGGWSNYPYFESGTVIMSDISGGLFILKPKLCPVVAATEGLSANASGDNQISLNWNLDLNDDETYNVYRSEGGCDVDNFVKIAEGIDATSFIDSEATSGAKVGYRISKKDTEIDFDCESARSACVETQTTGICTIAPAFTGIKSVNTSNTSTCGMDIQWPQASSYCAANLKYDVFRSQDPAFIPSNDNKIARDITENQWHDSSVIDDEEYYYLVRSTDASNGNQETNIVKLSDKTQGTLTNGTWQAGAEIGDGGFNQGTKHLGWEQVSTRKFTGERSYWSQSNPSACNRLKTETISLSTNDSSELSFWTAFDIDSQFDGGVVEITTDEQNWNSPDIDPVYPNVFRRSEDGCGYEFNQLSFTGSDLTWKKHTMDLSQYQGQDIKIRWNYSTDEENNGEGWFLDDIKITNSLTAAQCETQAKTAVQPGLWYDPSRNGHGLFIEPIGNDGLYFTVFYTYKDDGTPEWYTSLSTLENGILNTNLDNNTLQRFNYDSSINPVGPGTPNLIDESIGTNILSIDFNSDTIISTTACNDGLNRRDDSALVTWQLGEQQGTWCIEPLIDQNNYPTPDFGGTWWTGIDDDGWGLSIAFSGDSLVVVVYYYDANGKPRWVLGQKSGFEIGQSISLDLLEFTGFARDATPTQVSNIKAGTIDLVLNNNTQDLANDGAMSIDINYQGTEGGNWQRTNVPIALFTNPH